MKKVIELIHRYSLPLLLGISLLLLTRQYFYAQSDNNNGESEQPAVSIYLPIVQNAASSATEAETVSKDPLGSIVAAATCTPGQNKIVCENSNPGNPPSEWDVSGAGDPSIQGFATDISVNLGETVRFKVNTDATDYRLDIYRMGYYGGLGARKIAVVQPAATLPQDQPSCLTEPATGLIDCGNWAESASWTVPVTATSGIYFAKAVRTDTSGASHIVFIVRDDEGGSDLLFQTADTTWQAYNRYGGNSLYVGAPAGRAYKVSYNRPFVTREATTEDWVFNAEYPMVRWLEANGYDVSYFTGIDSDRLGGEILEHKVFLSVGHDEYWSAAQRANVEAARAAGIHLAFFSGNEIFWKTRWENSIDGSNTPYRTLVSYKETLANAKIDPLANVWTGTWRDPRFSPPADGGQPENALTGTIFKVNGGTTAITVPAADGKMRFWRNTDIATLAPGQTATLAADTLGYEWDEEADNGARPAGLIRLSSTTVNNVEILTDYGSTYTQGSANHNLTLYRHSSGALVFGAGTIQWSWGLDGNHDRGGSTPDVRMQQATVNLLADMGVQPGTLQPGLVAATQSTDNTPPTTTITTPADGGTVQNNVPLLISGSATDVGGVVGGVEVSVDGGSTWHRANGRASWSYSWTPTITGTATFMSRAADDSANLGVPVTIAVTVTNETDTTPPTVAGVSPLGGVTEAVVTTTVTALFSEAMDPATINGNTVELRDTANNLIGATITYDVANQTATLTPANPLAYAARYTATVRGGTTDPQVKDLAGNALAANVTWSFTTIALDANCPCTIWPASATPTLAEENDNDAVEVGVKFRSGMAGYITGIRFYKGSDNSGTHVGNLWSSSGQLLASATFVNETASGWQQVNFAAPVAINAGTTYIASYHAPVGRYALDNGYFATSGVTNGPLSALADGADGGNGVYSYGPSAFPTSSFSASNYWVDVVFVAAITPDTEAPTVALVSPAGGTTLTGTVTVSATATDNTAVAGVQFQVDGVNVGIEDVTPPYSVAWNTAAATNGTHTLTAVARDGAGNSTTSTGVNVTVNNPVDNTPPTVTSTNPPADANSVAVAAGVSAVFSEAIDQATINGDTIELRDAANNLVAATVSYNGINQTVTLTPATPLANATRYTATVKGGTTEPRVKDLAGNALAANVTWSFTTVASGFTCPCSLWDNSATPAVAEENDSNPTEVGVKFRSDVAGYVTGLRFYKGSGNTGTHIGNLWSSDGQLLASAVFVNETASGWQAVTFGAPVSINANTTYIASYYAPVGRYAIDDGFFATGGVSTGPLHALANGVDGDNGVYHYGASAFPTASFSASNYWVDVIFATEVGPDTVPPAVVTVAPANGATGVGQDTNVTVSFGEAMDPATINGNTIQLRDGANGVVAATVSYHHATRTATLDPTDALAYGTTYTVLVKGGATDPRVKDLAGNALAGDYTWSFTTINTPPPPTDEGPGGPILVIGSTANRFGLYYAEILRAEGLNAFGVADITQVSATTLTEYDLVILGEMALNGAQVTMFTDWVTNGGNLIAMRPDKQLAGLLGLNDAASTLSNGYLLVNTAQPPGTGIVNQSIQFHSTADLYSLNGATSIATLYSNATTPASNNAPAVTLRSVGSNGGQAAAFTYDLARSIVYMRQGNPAWESQERDGLPPMRSNDMYFGNAAGDPQADWVDLNKVAIPQADEQQRLLANLILQMNSDRKPLPRFWYFPKDHKAVVIMTGDDHALGWTKLHFNRFQELSPANCSVTDWECIRGTSYIYTATPLSDAEAFAYDAAGFEIALHVNTGCTEYTPSSLDADYSSQLAGFRAKYSLIPAPVTQRTHCIVWSDWATQAKVELQYGMRLDTTYYYFPESWVDGRDGFFTGSGMPMRFADLDGTMINVYQAATQMTDESGQSYPASANILFDRALGPEGYYGAFTTNMHTDRSVDNAEAIVLAAQARGIPVITARQMLEWLDGRNSSSFDDLTLQDNTLSFSITVGNGANHLRAMLPIQSAAGQLTGITRNGSAINYTTAVIKGIAYAIFPAHPGDYQAALFTDNTPPAVSITAPANDATVVDQVTVEATATDNFGVAGVQFILDGVNLGSEDTTAPYMVTWDTLTATNGSHQLTAVARDAAGNLTTSSVIVVTVDNPIDSTPPTVSTVTPPADTTGVPVTTTVSATFSEAIDPSTLDTTTVTLRDNTNATVAVTVSYNATSRTATLVPVGPLTNAMRYTVTIAGGASDPRVKDVAGNALATPYTWSFTTIGGIGSNCPCTIWTSETIPAIPAVNDASAIEVGVKFQSDLAGYITGIRFYKGPGNDGTHIGNLWSGNGQLLATATFINESATGWQQVNFATPVAIDANTTYVASYHTTTGFYAADGGYFATSDTANPPLRALANGTDGGNGLYQYGPSAFPTASYNATNYWVDVVYVTTIPPDTTPPTILAVTPADGASAVPVDTTVTVQFSEAINPTTVDGTTLTLYDSANNPVPATVSYQTTTQTAILTPTTPLVNAAVYTLTIQGGATEPQIEDLAGNALVTDVTLSFTTAGVAGADCPCTIWPETATPVISATNDATAIEVGVKFRSDIAGYITGIRFYKGAANTGTHIGNLWDSNGQLLTTATFINESATGWQQVNFATPVAIDANTTYVASYHTTTGFYAADSGYFAANGVINAPLQALANGIDGGNGLYRYGSSGFPSSSFNATNYWVDVVFATTVPPDIAAPTVSITNPVQGAIVSGTVNLVANATDDTVVAGVQFQVDGVNLGVEDTIPPYTVAWDTITAGNGRHVLTAIARDGAGNVTTSGPVTVSICPCSIWTADAVPAITAVNDPNAIELGVKFQVDRPGYITGIRFYKGLGNDGIHIGNLWDSGGQLLATATFVNESATGWQQVNFATPVAVTADTTYVASYHSAVGFYAVDSNYFASSEVNNMPLRALADGVDGPNGLYHYGSSGFPTTGFNASNYWVDVVFMGTIPADNDAPTAAMSIPSDGAVISRTVTVAATATDNVAVAGVQFRLDGVALGVEDTVPPYQLTWDTTTTTNGTHELSAVARDGAGNSTTSPPIAITVANDVTGPTVLGVTPSHAALDVAITTAISATFSEALDSLTINDATFALQNETGQVISATVSYNENLHQATLIPNVPLAYATTYTATLYGGATDPRVKDSEGNALTTATRWSFTTVAEPGANCPCTIWAIDSTPAVAAVNDNSAIEVGVKFQSDLAGYISGIRFYKGPGNTGPHIGNLWDSSGQLLATAPFVNETATGWQQINFVTPVAIAANTTYVASYHTASGFYAATSGYFANNGVATSPLRALANGADGPNGIYRYGASGFPTASYNATNYWVDVLFATAVVSDNEPPTVTLTTPADGAVVGGIQSISAAATDNVAVAGVQFQLNGVDLGAEDTSPPYGVEWDTTTVGGGIHTLRAVARDGAGNVSTATTVIVQTCPCTLWDEGASPTTAAVNDAQPIEVGVKFQTDQAGYISGIRFYKDTSNVGPHIGNLWSNSGELLATATFVNETATGWQQVLFGAPIAVAANTTYVASYHTASGFYAADSGTFATTGMNKPPLRALATGVDGGNGVFGYGPSAFPTNSFNGANYWVDVIFTLTPPADTTPPTVLAVVPADGAENVPVDTLVTLNFSEAIAPTTINGSTVQLRDQIGTQATGTVSYDAPTRRAIIVPAEALANSTRYTVTVNGSNAPNGAPQVQDEAGNALATTFTASFTTLSLGADCPCTIWPETVTPAVVAANDPSAIEVGVKFQADIDGYIIGLRFYKGPGNTGTHIGNLWSGSGEMLATAIFSDESVEGWQQVLFGDPVAITADTTYIASYHTETGSYAVDSNYFANSGVNRSPLRALANGVDGENGVYRYGTTGFPTNSYLAGNYWVDVIFVTVIPPDVEPPTVTLTAPSADSIVSGTVTLSADAADNIAVAGVQFQLDGVNLGSEDTLPPYTFEWDTATTTPGEYLLTAVARDGTGNLTPSAPLTVSICPCSLWAETAVPAVASVGDPNAIEVGVKFQTDRPGYITGIRFYKGVDNSGAHIGNLWDSNGELLATATFTEETPSGWQTVHFATPVAVEAETTYVASYHTDVGFYAADSGYFATNGVERGPLRGLANGIDGGNGIYQYGSSAFPTSTFNAANYWVDVLFTVEAQ